MLFLIYRDKQLLFYYFFKYFPSCNKRSEVFRRHSTISAKEKGDFQDIFSQQLLYIIE